MVRKLFIFLATVVLIIIPLSVGCYAFDISNLPYDAHGNYYYIEYNKTNHNYNLYINASPWGCYINTDITSQYLMRTANRSSSTVWVYSINKVDSGSLYYNTWTRTAFYNPYGGNGYQRTDSTNVPIIYVSQDIYNDSNVKVYGVENNKNLSSIDGVLNVETTVPGTNVNSGNDVQNSEYQGNVISGLNSIFNKLNDIFDELRLQVDGVYYTISQIVPMLHDDIMSMFDNIGSNIITIMNNILNANEEIKNSYLNMVNQVIYIKLMIQTLPQDIATELDKVLNPSSPSLPGSFGDHIQGSLEGHLLVINQMKTAFNGLESQNSKLSISKTITVGSLQFPFTINFDYFEPYADYIRYGLSGLFWVMLLIKCWSMISGIFSIGVNSAISSGATNVTYSKSEDMGGGVHKITKWSD